MKNRLHGPRGPKKRDVRYELMLERSLRDRLTARSAETGYAESVIVRDAGQSGEARTRADSPTHLRSIRPAASAEVPLSLCLEP